MRYTSSKGYLIGGIICFVLSGLLFCFGFVCLVLAQTEGEGSVFSKLGILALFAIVLIPFGIACLHKNGVNKIVLEGKKSFCTVEKVEIGHSRYSAWIYVDFSFKDKSGNVHTHTQSFNRYLINEFQIGNKFECYILGDKCFIDPNNIKIVDESSLTVDDTIEF